MEDMTKEPVSTQQLLDLIFRDPKTKYHLDLFTRQEQNRLQMLERQGRVRTRCMVRDRDFVAKPEEVVRQGVNVSEAPFLPRQPDWSIMTLATQPRAGPQSCPLLYFHPLRAYANTGGASAG